MSHAPESALLTDRYELTMLDSALADSTAYLPAVFEVFTRRLPPGRRYGVAEGLRRFVDQVVDLRFAPDTLEWLRSTGVIGARAAAYLSGWRFGGTIQALREGDLYFPGTPVLQVEVDRLADGLLLETLALSVLNHDCAVAAAAARMHQAAGARSLLEMGGRRVHEQAAVAAARAAYLMGFAGTSNLAAGRLHGVPTIGTAAHAWTLAHATERAAFAAQVARHGSGTTLLVDTYDTAEGIRTAVDVAGRELGAIRLDSGDPAVESRRARALLDSLGAPGARIVVTGDLDEYAITALSDAPIDTYGVGTRVVSGSGHPTAGLVYKLVAIGDRPVRYGTGEAVPLRPVAKRAPGKLSVGGRKSAWRELDASGRAVAEVVVADPAPAGTQAVRGAGRDLLVPVVVRGEVVHRPDASQIRAFHLRARAELPPDALAVTDGPPALEVGPPAFAGVAGRPAGGGRPARRLVGARMS